MIWEGIHAALGIAAVFLPGYLMTLVVFRQMSVPERICLGFGLSVFFVVVLSYVMTLFASVLSVKILTAGAVWFCMLIGSGALSFVLLLRKRKVVAV